MNVRSALFYINHPSIRNLPYCFNFDVASANLFAKSGSTSATPIRYYQIDSVEFVTIAFPLLYISCIFVIVVFRPLPIKPSKLFDSPK